ncbi:MAG: FlgD immunoglobulin-like domain containing protein [Bacteroidota bacterium]
MRKTLALKYLLLSMAFTLPALTHAQNLLHAPQKIVIDAPRNRLLVSNDTITGDIVEIDSAGNQTFFVQGAGFIDGMEIVGDTVYGVCKNRKIKAYHLVTRQLVMDKTITGASTKYLSSITSDSAGHLFISCPKLNEIYKLRISDQSWWLFANSGLSNPNGILLERELNRIVVIGDSPIPSSIYAISLTDSIVSPITATTFNSPDGIVRDKYGYYYVGGYYLTALYMIDPGFSQLPVSFFPGTSMVYLTYDIRDHSLLITHYDANSWERVPLTTTGIEPVVKQPSDFLLQPASPNPFTSYTTIRIELKRRTQIRLDICDSTGNLVKNLLNEEKETGTYSLSWDGTTASGQKVSSGIYYFRMTANGQIQTQKVIFI